MQYSEVYLLVSASLLSSGLGRKQARIQYYQVIQVAELPLSLSLSPFLLSSILQDVLSSRGSHFNFLSQGRCEDFGNEFIFLSYVDGRQTQCLASFLALIRHLAYFLSLSSSWRFRFFWGLACRSIFIFFCQVASPSFIPLLRPAFRKSRFHLSLKIFRLSLVVGHQTLKLAIKPRSCEFPICVMCRLQLKNSLSCVIWSILSHVLVNCGCAHIQQKASSLLVFVVLSCKNGIIFGVGMYMG